MNVTREIAMDLLPLYVAGEASQESNRAVEEFLKSDPDLARLAAELRAETSAGPVPAPGGDSCGPDSGRRALTTTKRLLRRRAWLMGLAIFFTALPLSFSFNNVEGFRFTLIRDSPLVAVLSVLAAAGLWAGFARVARRLRVTRL